MKIRTMTTASMIMMKNRNFMMKTSTKMTAMTVLINKKLTSY